MKKTLRVLTAGLLGTATIATIGLPDRARAAGFSYVYAYQQITNLKAVVSNPLSITFGSDNVSNAAILQGITNNPLNLQSVFDVNESFVRPPTIGQNLGLGNNAGFLTAPAAPNFSSDIGTINPDYARGDAQLVGITDTNQIAPALFDPTSTGLSLVGVAESYLTTPTQLEANGFFLNQGNGIGRTLLASNNFTVANPTTIDFSYDYRNEGFAELTLATPPGAPLGNQAAGRIAFVITINTIAGINVNPVYTCNSFLSNTDFGGTDVGASNLGVNAGSVPLDDSGEGCEPFQFLTGTTYRIDFRNELIADTRLLDAPIVPEPGATGMLLGLGSFGLFRLTIKRNKK